MKITRILTKNDLLAVPIPAKTSTYQPIPHSVLFEEVYEKLDKKGLSVIGEEFRADNEGNKLIAKLRINQGNSEMSSMIAFRNSYDKSMSVAYGAGNQVVVNY